MNKQHWREIVSFDGDHTVLGEDEDGRLWMPSKFDAELWDRIYNPFNPTHWFTYLRSRWRKTLAFLETVPRTD